MRLSRREMLPNNSVTKYVSDEFHNQLLQAPARHTVLRTSLQFPAKHKL